MRVSENKPCECETGSDGRADRPSGDPAFHISYNNVMLCDTLTKRGSAYDRELVYGSDSGAVSATG